MWKIIKSNLEQVQIKKEKFLLWMKWQFKIEFANDSFWPYEYKFAREDCYFIDSLQERGSALFPLKNTSFDNTEIFLENDEVIICSWERGGLLSDTRQFIDIINLKTEKKQRIFMSEVNLIYNEKSHIVINAKIENTFQTFFIDIQTLEIVKKINEELQAFFKCVYNATLEKWFVLDFEQIGAWWNQGFFHLKELEENQKPKTFDRDRFLVNATIDVWELSCK